MLQLFQIDIRTHEEQAAVPVDPPFVQHGFGRFDTGFFNETIDGKAIFSQGDTLTDIAISRFGCGRRDSEGDDMTGGRQRCGFLNTGGKSFVVTNGMVGGHDEKECIISIVFHGCIGGKSNRRGRVSGCRFQNDLP